MTTTPSFDRETQHDRRRLRRSVLVLSISLVSVGVALVSALYTFTATNPDNVFSTGNIHLSLVPATAMFVSETLDPGDTVHGNINVDNDGSMDLRYAVTGLTTASITDGTPDATPVNTLADSLELTIRTGVTPGDCAAGTVAGGTIIYGPGPTSAITTARNLVGDPAPGQDDPADTGMVFGADRLLAAGVDEDLCFSVALPSGDDNQTASVTVAWNFEAEQTANNP